MKKGVDVSKWQGVMNWGITAKRADFAYVKACQALFTDTQFEANYQGAMAAGIPLGFYCYWDNKADWFAQTAYFLEIIKTHPAGLLPVLDLEMTSPAPNVTKILSAVAMIADQIGRLPMIYSGPSYIVNYLYPAPEIANCPLWIAHYSTNPKWPLDAPRVPLPWFPMDWAMWQFSADGNNQGKYYGAQSRAIDLNVAWELPVV